jgi:hypothetical protein
MAKRGGVIVRARDSRGGRESREDVMAEVAKMTVSSGGRGSGGKGVGLDNMGGGICSGEANGGIGAWSCHIEQP